MSIAFLQLYICYELIVHYVAELSAHFSFFYFCLFKHHKVDEAVFVGPYHLLCSSLEVCTIILLFSVKLCLLVLKEHTFSSMHDNGLGILVKETIPFVLCI